MIAGCCVCNVKGRHGRVQLSCNAIARGKQIEIPTAMRPERSTCCMAVLSFDCQGHGGRLMKESGVSCRPWKIRPLFHDKYTLHQLGKHSTSVKSPDPAVDATELAKP